MPPVQVPLLEQAQEIRGAAEMKAALYARVSSEEQVEGYSIDAKLRACRNFAKEKDWPVVAEYVDEGKSARAEDVTKRPRFKAMLEAAKNREFDILIVHKLDRFSRNLLLTLKCFDELSRTGTTFTDGKGVLGHVRSIRPILFGQPEPGDEEGLA